MSNKDHWTSLEDLNDLKYLFLEMQKRTAVAVTTIKIATDSEIAVIVTLDNL